MKSHAEDFHDPGIRAKLLALEAKQNGPKARVRKLQELKAERRHFWRSMSGAGFAVMLLVAGAATLWAANRLLALDISTTSILSVVVVPLLYGAILFPR